MCASLKHDTSFTCLFTLHKLFVKFCLEAWESVGKQKHFLFAQSFAPFFYELCPIGNLSERIKISSVQSNCWRKIVKSVKNFCSSQKYIFYVAKKKCSDIGNIGNKSTNTDIVILGPIYRYPICRYRYRCISS